MSVEGGAGSMLVLNDPASQISSAEGATAAAPAVNLSSLVSRNDLIVKVCRISQNASSTYTRS